MQLSIIISTGNNPGRRPLLNPANKLFAKASPLFSPTTRRPMSSHQKPNAPSQIWTIIFSHQFLNNMLWHDSLKDLLPREETLHTLLKVDNAKSHTPPPPCASVDDHNLEDDDDRSIFLFETNEQPDPEASQSVQQLGHFSFPITPRQRTLLLTRQPYLTPKKNNRRQPARCSSFDDTISSSAAKRAPRRGRRRPDRACSVDDLGKWAGVTPASTRSNVTKPCRRLSNEMKKDAIDQAANASLTNVSKPKRRLSNGGYA